MIFPCPDHNRPTRRFLKRAARGVMLAGGLAAAALHAQLPTGGTVVAGQATIENGTNSTTITAGNNSILHWGSFNVGLGSAVQFVQPGADARVLNLIGNLTPSQINGTLSANGQVYLVNPAGIYFGQSAVVNVGALYAIGGAMAKEDFLAGLNRFSGLTGAVTNAGAIQGAVVGLVGRSVANTGTIVSPGGFIGLAAGGEVLFGQNGSRIYVDTGLPSAADATPSGTGVSNTGMIDAGRGSAVLAAGDLYSIAITQDGRLSGRDVRLQGQGRGDVLVSGMIDASATDAGETGGRVEITGEHVGLIDNATID
ncbi:MAG: filamentous hemagglutinin family outer membrane protein, partial [Lacunisphaera sp.]|nr:filamentous hemagglutinin family outer membrane protein [Lacunisphaera sp.]